MHRLRSELAHRFPDDEDRSPDAPVELLGGKGAGLVAMAAMGLPVPPGFTLTTEACGIFLEDGWTDELDATVRAELAALERSTGKRLGDPDSPLLVSVRSGAASSMPGMMDTVLDVGMTDAVAAGLREISRDPTFAADTHRRALLSFAEVVYDASELVSTIPTTHGAVEIRTTLAAAGIVVPEDPEEQVVAAVRAVFDSWMSERARQYRSVEGIDDRLGTAVTVQTMVFGNLGPDSGTGVAFTRDPSSGEPGLMGDFLTGAQGEDVVSGRHPTRPISDVASLWPDVFDQLVEVAEQLEHHYADMVDIEFTVERARLWLLQARRAKRSPIAAFRAAVDMADDPSFPVDRAEAVRRCRDHLAAPPTVVDESAADADAQDDDRPVIATGLPASPGVATGVLCTDVDQAVDLAAQGTDVVLVRRDTSPSDVAGMVAAVGLATVNGGLVSHAAVVARSWGLPAVVGATDLELVEGGVIGSGGRVELGDVVTIDGDRGQLLLGRHATSRSEPPHVTVVRSWARELDHPPAPARPSGTDETDGPDVAPSTDQPFLVLHAARIKGMATIDTLVSVTGIAPESLHLHLEALAAAGDLDFLAARGMYRITKAGKASHAVALTDAVTALELDSLAYDQFLALNTILKSLCTEWQIRDGEPNDHSDRDHDTEIIERLGRLDDDAQTVVRSFGPIVPWTSRYAPRLAAARERVVAGDVKAFTGVMCESYHDIWMELHEDLILTQGIDRTEEGSH